MESNSADLNNDIVVDAAPPAAGPQTKPAEQPQSPAMSPADVRLCNVGGRAVGWFVFLLGVVSAAGSAWALYLIVRWLWFGGMARELAH
ncbi:MAG TPA: hypothetical protein VHP11_02550 [Tepidisphaeraceae bacterium]|nr:hypothetical protein [Tepidisphaeraceae bacterium]